MGLDRVCRASLLLVLGCAPRDAAPARSAVSCTLFLDETREEPDCAHVGADGALSLTETARRRIGAGAPGPVGLALGGRLYYANGAGVVREALPFDNGPDSFVEGLARTVAHGKVGFMDEQLGVRIAPAWDFALPFDQGVALVCSGCSEVREGEHHTLVGCKWGYIDARGALLVPVEHDRATLPPPPQRPEVEADADPYSAAWRAKCKGFAGQVFPASDRPSPEQKAGLVAGDAARYYYGIGVPVDHVKARYAALVELDADYGAVFGDKAILMMLYANAFGVARNIPLALALACQIEGAPAEVEGRLRHLEQLDSAPGHKPFDLCDDVTSGLMEGHCAGLDEERAEAKRALDLDRLRVGWPPEHVAALDALRTAAQAFQEARAAGELDLSGTARGALIIGEESAQRALILKAVQRYEHGKFPTRSAAHHTRADATLNATYTRALKSVSTAGMSSTAEGVRAAERSWLAYRKAFLAFVAQRYPAATSASVDTWLIEVRTKQLKELVFE